MYACNRSIILHSVALFRNISTVLLLSKDIVTFTQNVNLSNVKVLSTLLIKTATKCTHQTLRIGPTYNTLLVSKTERNMFSHASHITLSSTYRCSYQAWERYSLLMMAFLRFFQRVWSHSKYRNCRLKNVHTIKHRNESGYAQGNVKFYNL